MRFIGDLVLKAFSGNGYQLVMLYFIFLGVFTGLSYANSVLSMSKMEEAYAKMSCSEISREMGSVFVLKTMRERIDRISFTDK
jgi:hypothetical protein